MPPLPEGPQRILPLHVMPASQPHPGGRAAITCLYRCGNACAHEAPNTSDNPYLGDVIANTYSRRTLFRAGAVLTLAGLGASLLQESAAAAPDADLSTSALRKAAPGLRFPVVAPNTEDAVVTPPGYEQTVVIGWGDAVLAGAPPFDTGAQSPAAQALQFGFNCDYLALLPVDGSRRQFVLVANHEYTTEVMMFSGYDPANPTQEQVEIGWAAHGMSVVVVNGEKGTGRLTPAAGHELNQRITATTPIAFTGPAAGGNLLKTTADPAGTQVLGTLNNCGGGITPWGTVLTGEENFNQYFANANQVTDEPTKTRLARYGLAGGASERKWERFDPRFDLSAEPNEANRFGWVMEIDPYDPTFTPRKRTALGRFKHEAAEPRLTRDGRVALYMGDDERFDYFYKFVSTNRFKKGNSQSARDHNLTLLDEGTLYVARFTGDSPPEEIDGTGTLPSDGAFDGTGEWIPLATSTQSHVPGFTAEEVYVYTRLAADAVGATKMDRPEDIEPHPQTGTVYIALTNNTNRGAAGRAPADEANPRNNNKHGHIMEVAEDGKDSAAGSFQWRIALVCGDPNDPSTYFGGFPKDQVSPISCPDNVAFDKYGNLWIATDGNALGTNDGLFGVATTGKYTGQVKQFLTVPHGAETCGPIIDKDRILVAVQHPGELTGATADNPLSHWPDGADSLPRPSVVSVWRADGNNCIGEVD